MSSEVHNPLELDDIRRELERADTPLKASVLGDALKQKRGKGFKAALDAEVSAGRIYSWGAGQYWDRNPREMARQRLLNLAKGEFLSTAALKKRAAAESPKINTRVLGDVLQELIRENLLPGAKEVARDRLLNLSKKELLTTTQLIERAAAESPPVSLTVIRSVRKALITEKSLLEVKGSKLNVNLQHPEPYLELEIGRLLAEFGVERSKERIRELLGSARANVEPEPYTDVPDVAEKIFAAMNRIAFAPGTTVTFYRLRQQPELADIPKPVFDRSALLLQQQRRALLAVHGHAPRLPKAEQDELVTDGLGTYYVSIYAI